MKRRRSIMHLLFVIAATAVMTITTSALPTTAELSQRQKAATSRAERFPSVEERVRLYMSNWYLPPCANYSQGFLRYSYHGNNNNHNSNPQHDESNYNVLHLKSTHRPPRSHKKNVVLPSTEYYYIEPAIQPDQVFYVDRAVVFDCARSDDELQQQQQQEDGQNNNSTFESNSNNLMVKFRWNMRMYCLDTVRLLQEAWDHVAIDESKNNEEEESEDLPEVPLLLQYGDMKTTHIYGLLEVPHIKKFRSAAVDAAAVATSPDVPTTTTTPDDSVCLQQPPRPLATVHGSNILQPIIWKLATHRHYRLLPTVYRQDTPWSSKRNQAVFRGQLTGALDFYNKSLSAYDNCMQSCRCRLVYHHAESTLIDAKLTSTRRRLPTVLHNVSMISPSVTIRHLLEYKAIIMLEGNDVASGLKWALLSQSVVLMPPPQHTSWAMEELLQPWVHYIPLLPDASDVEEKMQWIVQHDEEARWIAEQGTLWMEDLVFHPDAKQDDRQIDEEIVRRYRAHFCPAE